MVRVQVVVHKEHGVLVPLLDHTLEEDGNGNQLVPDLSYIKQMELSPCRNSFHLSLSNLSPTTVTYGKAMYTTLNAFEFT
jgi:hypothetical protein